MGNPTDIKSFLAMVVEDFGEFLVHNIAFKDQESALTFFSSLSFVKQTPEGLSMPSHIKAMLVEHPDGTSLCIAAKPQLKESLEIRQKCLAENIKDEFLAIGKEKTTSTAQTINEQLGQK
jgi:hypothetical protein